MKKIKLIFVLIFLLLSFQNCYVENKTIQFGDAYITLQEAIDYKYKECGTKPEQILIPPSSSDPNSLRLCSIAIIRSECPFNEYPVFCYDLFYEFIKKN